MSRTNIILLVIFILIISAGIPLITRFVIPSIFPSKETPVSQIKPKNLPVDPSNKGIQDVRTIYTFKGKITEVKKKPNFEIKTDIKAANLPSFIVTGGTIISQKLDGQILPMSAGKLSKGKTVTIVAEYNNRKKNWRTSRVTINERSNEPNPEPEIGQSSPSASPKK